MKPKHRHSLRDGVNGLYRARPGETGFCVTVACRSSSANLAPATRAPGPHALAVRACTVRLKAHARPSLPASRVVTMRIRPSCRGGMRGENHKIMKIGSKIFFARG